MIWKRVLALDAYFGGSLTGAVQEQFQGIMSALIEYWNGPMTTYFWGAQVGQKIIATHGFDASRPQNQYSDSSPLQFINDVEGQLNNGNNSADNAAAAADVQVRS